MEEQCVTNRFALKFCYQDAGIGGITKKRFVNNAFGGDDLMTQSFVLSQFADEAQYQGAIVAACRSQE